MGVRFPSVASTAIIAGLPANGAETVVCTAPPINEPIDNAQVILLWYCALVAGTTVTSFTPRLRRGTLVTSPVINQANSFTTVAGNLVLLSGCYVDLPGIVAGQQYSLTFAAAAATGVSAVNDVCLIAMVL